MKRRPHPLFHAIEPDVYLIDTSGWLNIDGRADCAEVWAMILRLVEKGRIVCCSQVLHELETDPTYLKLKPHEKALLAGDRDGNDMEYLRRVGRITYDHPAMSKATGRKTPADPYVVALAELEHYVVVADESLKRPSRKIPGVCQQRRIRCLTVDEFVLAVQNEENGQAEKLASPPLNLNQEVGTPKATPRATGRNKGKKRKRS